MRRDDPDVFEVPAPPVLPAPPDRVIAALGGLATPERLARMREVAAARTYRVALVLEGLTDPHNASAILRSADAFGVQRVHVVPGPHGFLAARRVSRGTERWLDIVGHATPGECVDALHELGYRVLLASMDGTLTPADLPRDVRLAFAFGHEHKGPTPEMRERVDGTYRVPMRGFVESLNVSVAAAITLHHATLGCGGDLTEGEQQELLARFLLGTVRDAERIVRESLG